MNLSSILVVTAPLHLDSCITQLNSLPGISVHFSDIESARIIIIQEAESINAEVDGLKCIKALPQVLFAEMVYHYFENDTEAKVRMPKDLDEMQGLSFTL